MREELEERDVALAVGRELGHVLADPVGERERALLDQLPDRAAVITLVFE